MSHPQVLVALLICVACTRALSGNVDEVVKYANAAWNCAGDAPPCPNCPNRVKAGSWQSPYGCAPFVAHALAAGGYVDLGDCGDMDAYSNVQYRGETYNLNVVSKHDPNCGGGVCLTDYLMAIGWKQTSTVTAGTVCAVVGSDGPYCHVVIGVGDNICDAHNYAAYQVSCDNYQQNLCLKPNEGACDGKTDGAYCEENRLIQCRDGKNVHHEKCHFTCVESVEEGKSLCASQGSCETAGHGDFCGNDKVNATGFPNALFFCKHGRPFGAEECRYVCQKGHGHPDRCWHNSTLKM